MLIVYDSLTGNVRSFVEKSGLRAIPITEDLLINEPYVLVTYTINFGQVPTSTMSFLSKNQLHMKGVASSGNRIWGSNFAVAGDKISEAYHVPLLLKFELRGSKQNVNDFQHSIQKMTEVKM